MSEQPSLRLHFLPPFPPFLPPLFPSAKPQQPKYWPLCPDNGPALKKCTKLALLQRSRTAALSLQVRDFPGAQSTSLFLQMPIYGI